MTRRSLHLLAAVLSGLCRRSMVAGALSSLCAGAVKREVA